MIDRTDIGKLVLRLGLGSLLLLHGIGRMWGGLDFLMPALARHGLPGALAHLAYAGEIFAPLALILGAFTRLAAALVVVNTGFTVFLIHMTQLGEITPDGGWALELQAFHVLGALVLMLQGAGRFSIGGSNGRYN